MAKNKSFWAFGCLILIIFGLIGLVIFSVYLTSGKTDKVSSDFHWDIITGQDKIGLVEIKDIIYDSREIVKQIKDYVKRKDVKGILLRIDSPGGGVAPSQEIYKAVKEAKEKKPVVVTMGSVAASGGYYVASPATLIFSNPGSITGSIGVLMVLINIEGLLEKVGVNYTALKSGKLKDAGAFYKKISPEDSIYLSEVINDVYNQFIEDVATARNIPIDSIKKLADGRTFTGKQALKTGLIDFLGTFDDAFKKCSELAGIKGEPYLIEKKPPKKAFWFDILFDDREAKLIKYFKPGWHLLYLMPSWPLK